MKKIISLSFMVLTISFATAQIVEVSVYADCSKNGYSMGMADVLNTSGRTSCGYVQLWENGPKWATFNVGATITDYANLTIDADATSFHDYTDKDHVNNSANIGGLFAWKNPTIDGRSTSWTSSVSTNISDVATTLWGGNWKTPTKAQLDTLQNAKYGKTTWVWCDGSTTQYVKGCTIAGYKVSGVDNYAGYSIFLPSTGYYSYSYSAVNRAGGEGYYWSNTTDGINTAYCLSFTYSYQSIGPETRKLGRAVRAVLTNDEKKLSEQLTLTLYVSGCERANIITCSMGQKIRISVVDTTDSRFVQWSDGNTDNPRLVTMTSNKTLIAQSNKCGDNLTWSYDNGTLSISGTDAMYDFTQSTAPWMTLFKDSITNIVIVNGCTSIGNYAFYGCANKNLKTINLPNSVNTIGQYAFAECSWLKTVTMGTELEDIKDYAFANDQRINYVTCYAVEPPLLQSTSFSNWDAYLSVPCETVDDYKVSTGWKLFTKENVRCIGADPATTTKVVVTPSDNTATITWPTSTDAADYTIEIKKDGEVFCTLTFNAQGQLTNIAFAPGRGTSNDITMAETVVGGYRFTISSLNPGTTYTYVVDTKNAGGTSIANYTGAFITTGTPTSLDQLNDSSFNIQNSKFIKDGQLFILHDGHTYTTQGAELQ